MYTEPRAQTSGRVVRGNIDAMRTDSHGTGLINELAKAFKVRGVRGLGVSNLENYRQMALTWPKLGIRQTSGEFIPHEISQALFPATSRSHCGSVHGVRGGLYLRDWLAEERELLVRGAAP